jgi:hypothetical protein
MQYRDQHGVLHRDFHDPLCELWRKVMKHHMDACHEAGLDGVSAANLLLNGAAYLLGAVCSEMPDRRRAYTEEMVKMFRFKVEQAVHEGRADRAG